MRRSFLSGFSPLLLLLPALICGCAKDDPEPTPGLDGGQSEPGCAADETITPHDGAGCTAHADDYQPRVNGSADDSWPACISDDNSYHAFQPNISTNARIAGFEQIAKLLGFGEGTAASPAAFLEARTAYTQPEGLDSRVSRREDEHYPPAPELCRDLSEAELAKYPDRCVGPAQIQPLLSAAFADGIKGIEPPLAAARVEAALLWMFYVSSYKEATTCAVVAKDCDSSTGYYAGNQSRELSFGFARYVQARSQQAHDASWDALLAVRCWRDLDNPTGEAKDLVLQAKALGQLDRALDRGLALILRQRIETLPCNTAWETIEILGPVLDRAATAKDAAQAKIVREQIAAGADKLDKKATLAALDALFPCP